jgi:type II secretory pathway component PulC
MNIRYHEDGETDMKKSGFPEGWDEDRVRRVLEHYEEQTEDEAVAEDEAAYEDQTESAVEVPVELVPAVRELIAKHKR